jgi:hypothetical protein
MVCSTCSHVGCAVQHVLQLAELEQPRGSVDESLPHIGELLAWSRQVNNKKDGMGGLDQYLIQLLCCSKPGTLRAAMQRLETAHKSNVQVCFLLLISSERNTSMVHAKACTFFGGCWPFTAKG